MLGVRPLSSSFSSCSGVHRKLKARRKPAPPFLGSGWGWGSAAGPPPLPGGSAYRDRGGLSPGLDAGGSSGVEGTGAEMDGPEGLWAPSKLPCSSPLESQREAATADTRASAKPPTQDIHVWHRLSKCP